MPGQPQLFGTDGVRGIAGHYPLDRNTVRKLGRAVGEVLKKSVPRGPIRVVMGEDTRESSAWISRSLAAGFRSTGVEVAYAGVITTPGVAFLARRHGFAAGVIVSASHNPYEDNGIKIVSESGMKIAGPIELEVERVLSQLSADGQDTAEPPLESVPHLPDDYVEYLQNLVPKSLRLSKYRLVVDCAHGASSRVVPEVLKRLGIAARILYAAPNGRNINLGCGSLHPEVMAEETKTCGADLGVAFDGDADRAIFATRHGYIADGDHILFAIAPFFKSRGKLKGEAVVGTLMTNLALELALAQHAIGLKRTPVGDKYVLEEMLRSGINLGGEPSGHIIFSDLSQAGDGIITLLQVLELLEETQKPLDNLVGEFRPFPQVILNVRVREKPPLESIPTVARAITQYQHECDERGRVVVRYSGTEPVARVMVEGERAEVVERHAAQIARTIESALGSK